MQLVQIFSFCGYRKSGRSRLSSANDLGVVLLRWGIGLSRSRCSGNIGFASAFAFTLDTFFICIWRRYQR